MKKFNRQSSKGVLLVAFLALALILATVAPLLPGQMASAQQGAAALTLQAEPAYDGYFKYGEWLPVWVELENNGPDLAGELSVSVRGNSAGATVFALPVSLPTVSHKRVAVYVLPNNFSRELDVQFNGEDQLLASQKIRVRPQPNITYLAGLITPERGALGMISGIELPGQERPVVLVDLSLAELPERVEGLRSFDSLILNDVDTSTLSPQQAQALENWVQTGGRLVIGGGAGARKTLSGLPQGLQLLVPQGEIELEAAQLESLASYAGTEPIQAAGTFLAASGENHAGRLLAGNQQLPLVVEQSTGKGNVDFIALDPSRAPFEGWSGANTFWQELLSPGAAFPMGQPPDMSERQQRASQIPYALSNLPVLDLPSAKGLAILLGFYILLVGPLNYLVLRWRKRLHWAWVTIPAITILFSAGAFSMGYLLRGTDLILNRIAYIEVQPGGSANVTSYMGLFSPGNQSYQVNLTGGGLVSPVQGYYDPWGGGVPTGGEMTFVQGEPGEVRGLSVNQWSQQSFMVEDVWQDFGTLSADLKLVANGLQGQLRNETDYPLKDVVVIMGRRFVRLGDLQPGEARDVSLTMEFTDQDRFGPPISYLLFENQLSGTPGGSRQADVKRSIVESLLDRPWYSPTSSMKGASTAGLQQGPIALAWMDEAPPEVTIAGNKPAQQTTALVYASLTYSLPEDGQVSLPVGMIPGVLAQMPAEGGMCGDPSSPSVYLARGEAVFEFQTPQEFGRLQVEKLKLSAWSDSGWWQSPGTAVYDWQDESWRELQELSQGVNEIPQAQNLVSPDGRIRIRLSSENNMQGCFYLGLGMDASRMSEEGS